MKLNNPLAGVMYSIVLTGSLVLALPFVCSSKQRIDTRGWGLVEFIGHLHTHGINLRVIAAREDGPWGDNVYLTENADETWLSFQRKLKGVEHIEQWRGSVWVVWNDPHDGGITHVASPSWGRYCCQIGCFLIFGDDQVIERIQQAFS